MNHFTPELFAQLWQLARQAQQVSDPDLARIQKFMLLHDDMHEHLDRIAADPQTPVHVDGENIMLHLLMDAATENSLEQGQPEGIREVMQGLLDTGMDPGVAFHVLSQAMQHSFVLAAEQQQDMNPADYLARARDYAAQATGARG